jgi:FSR family fosmidomycin resistance protein-like MFS transporter
LNKRITTFWWMQLLVLSAVHFFIDMFAGMLPPLVPAIRQEFALSLSLCVLLVVVLNMTSNGVQVLTGHMRAQKRSPLFLHIGLILAAGICLIGLLPRAGGAFVALLLLSTVSGCGIAVVHPEALRAVHHLRRIPPAVSTAVFMAGGFLGYASSGAVSTVLVSRFGLRGLYPLILCPAVGILLVIFLRIRLAIEPTIKNKNKRDVSDNRLPFWFIFAMAMPAAVSTIVLASLLPTVLDELGFELTFGGFSVTMFGLGGAVGSFVWAGIAHKKGELRCSVVALFLAVPFLAAYLIWIDKATAIWMMFGVGFCSISAYTLMITLARYAVGPNLGRRMALMVGGTWALANTAFLALLPLIKYFGADIILKFIPLGYVLSAFFGLFIMFRVRRLAGEKIAGK